MVREFSWRDSKVTTMSKASDKQSSGKQSSDKRKLIAEMIAMQKRLIARGANASGDADDGDGDGDQTPSEQRSAFAEMATRVVDLAHKERGTSR